MGYPVENPAVEEFSDHVLLEKYAYLVKRAIRHLKSQTSASFDDQDFYQTGLMGLLEAARRCEKIDEGFPRFAFKRIRGAILDELRRMDPRSRSLRQSVHQMKKKRRELARKLQKEPSIAELAEYVQMNPDTVRDILESDLDNSVESFEDVLQDKLSGSDEQSKNDLAISLAKIFDRLNERDRLVVQLYYYEDMNMKEIALVLGLTEPRVSQIHKQILSTIKKMM